MTSHPRSGASMVARKVGYFVAVMVIDMAVILRIGESHQPLQPHWPHTPIGWWGRSQGRVWRPTSRGRGGEWGWLSMIYPPIPTAWASRAMSSGAICECRHKIASTTPAQAQRHRRRRAPAGGGEIARRSMTRTLVPHPSRAILRSTRSLEAKSVSASVPFEAPVGRSRSGLTPSLRVRTLYIHEGRASCPSKLWLKSESPRVRESTYAQASAKRRSFAVPLP